MPARCRCRSRYARVAAIAIATGTLAGCATTPEEHGTAIRTTTQELARYQGGVSDELGAFMLAFRPQGEYADARVAPRLNAAGTHD